MICNAMLDSIVKEPGCLMGRSRMSFTRTLALLMVGIAFGGSAVARDWAPPPSAKLAAAELDTVMVHELEPIFPEQLVEEDRAREAHGPGPLRFALAADVRIGPATHGTWDILDDGSRLWRLRIVSPNATDLNFGFTRFRLPEGATLHLVSEEHDYFQGPYGAADNRSHGELWTPVIPGERAVIELYVPAEPAFEPELGLGRIGRGYRDLFKITGKDFEQGDCNIDVICGPADGFPWVDEWRAETQSVGRYSVNIPGATGFCTGTLVMDAEQSFRPYFLTAHHCEIDSTNDQTVVTYWNYESPACGQLAGGSLNQSVSGSTYVAGRTDADFTLIELDSTPPPGFRPYWAGWDRRDNHIPDGSVTIHHPAAREKAISLNDDPLSIITACIIVDDVGNTVAEIESPWRVNNWEQGTTEAGSSGAGLWDTDTHRLVGTLSGGFLGGCDNPGGSDCYERLAVAWDGDSADERLGDWLDPGGTGGETVAGRYKSGAGGFFSCGNAGYDNDTAETAAWFNGGLAGEPDYMFGVRFELADFGYLPGEAEIAGFCASNTIAFTGGPWPNEVFIYPDDGGSPDDSQILGQGTISTGDGSGDAAVMLDQPVVLNGDFWLINRGDPMHAGEDFNMEFDAGPNTGNSLVSSEGIGSLSTDNGPEEFPEGVNYMLRAYLQPVGSGPTYTYLVAGMARLSGAQGTNWRSKLALLNRSGGAASATLSYVRAKSTTTATIELADGELESWDNVVEDLFGVSGKSSGAIKVESDRPLVVTARTYNLTDDGTLGQFLPGVVSSETFTSGEPGVVSQLANNASFRSNVGFINLSAMECQVRVQLHDASGTPVGSPVTVTVGPMGWKQVNDIFKETGAGSHDNAYATVEILTPNCRIWGYGSVVDNGTGDPTTIPMEAE
jgi:hypothetical protein